MSRFLIVFVLGIIVGCLGFYIFNRTHNHSISFYPVRENSQQYSFINPLFFYDGSNSNNLPAYSDLLSKMHRDIDTLKKDPNVQSISIYYRNLTKGQWIGINETEQYTPASLLKVVVMITLLKQAESDPALLSRRILFSKQAYDAVNGVAFSEPTTLKPNAVYSLGDLINAMIISSDNGATFALTQQLNQDLIYQTFVDLGLANPSGVGRAYTISAKSYASFFRVLYNATYLSRLMSEKALSLLSKTDFKDGLVAQIPGTVVIAHKYGENVSSHDGKTIDLVELHDCGIAYVPSNPYFICIMTKGHSVESLKQAIQKISATIYNARPQ